MKGGRQVGGPWLKGLLSRMAGLTLHWLSGLPTHDPTNSFKAYRRDFLQRTTIESTAGFCLGLELTVKAHFNGGRRAARCRPPGATGRPAAAASNSLPGFPTTCTAYFWRCDAVFSVEAQNHERATERPAG